MTIHLIGSEGFIGRAIKEKAPKNMLACWSHQTNNQCNYIDLLNKETWADLLASKPETVILLSWPGLPNYNENFHLTRNLPLAVEFVDQLVKSGCKYIIITGTCYEYGNKSGKLSENLHCNPCNQYAIAKDTLRRSAEIICRKYGARLVWLRLFYIFGLNQNSSSLYPSFVEAIKRGDSIFEIGSQTQIRDFLHVDKATDLILKIANNQKLSGIFNCGSGKPRSVLELVKRLKEDFNSRIKIVQSLNFARTNESEAFWADMSKTNRILMHSTNHD